MAQAQQIAVDPRGIERDLERLAEFGATPSGGVSRIAYSPQEIAARDWFEEQCGDLAMSVRRDAAGNSIALLEGEDASLDPIAIVSHTDSVTEGGRYDGSLGIVGGLACVRALRDAGAVLRRPLALVDFEAEEATMGGATFGSRAFVGQLDPGALRRSAVDGIEVGRHLERAGLNPAAAADPGHEPMKCAAAVELHVEQGPVLDSRGASIGIAEGVVGIRRYEAIFYGTPNHAGTTPMEDRSDALVAAAGFIVAVRDVTLDVGIVGTVGSVNVSPGIPNVIPGLVSLEVELRSADDSRLDAAEESLRASAHESDGELDPFAKKGPIRFSPLVMDSIAAVASELEVEAEPLWSGAGHDAGIMASITEAGMIFVPSAGGVSHSPDEYTRMEDCVTGAECLLRTVIRLDSKLG